LYRAQKNSKSTRLKGMDEFLEAEMEVGQAKAADFSGYCEETAKEPYPRRS